jgi:antitoxin component YwqK of YwqJK toxin-antitoxin module
MEGMEKLLAAMFVALLMAGCGDDGKLESDSSESNQSSAETPEAKTAEVAKVVVDGDKIELRDGLFYFKGEPFTGVAVEKADNGQTETTYKDGKKHGLEFSHRNGQKSEERTWKNDKKDGLWTSWYDNGQKWFEKTYENGKKISEKWWDKDGNLTREYPKP